MLKGDVITAADIPVASATKADTSVGLDDAENEKNASPVHRGMKEVEWDLIEKTLAECGGNRSKAAEILGISRRTIQRRLSEHEKSAEKA